MAFDAGLFGSGAGGLAEGIWGHPEKPYDEAMKKYKEYYDKSQQQQKPYTDAGTGAISDYQKWLQPQQDPSKFINDQIGNYHESEYANNLQKDSMRAGQNAASASGLSGSTPLMQQLQQNAGSITSKDQNDWLNHVLGINTQYGQGQKNLIDTGQSATNSLTDLNYKTGKDMAEQEYNKQQARENNKWNTIGSAASMGLSFL